MRDFTWSPKENILAYWVAEDKVTFLTSQGCIIIMGENGKIFLELYFILFIPLSTYFFFFFYRGGEKNGKKWVQFS